MTRKPATIDECLATLRPDQRAALNRLRKTIRSVAPGAEECITYGLPGFRLHGRALVAFGAREGHCSFFPMSDATIAEHKAHLKNFETSKGTVRFQPEAPIPAATIRLLVKARIAENAALALKPRSARVRTTPKATR